MGIIVLCFCYVSRLMLRPNLAYSSTFSCDISSLIVLSFSSRPVTSFSILLVDAVSNSWTSGNGKLMKESPILYLRNVSLRTCLYHRALPTVSCRPHLPAPARLIYRPDPPSPSVQPSALVASLSVWTDVFRFQFVLEVQFSLV